MAFAVTLFYGYFTIFFFFSFSLNSVRLCVRAFNRHRRCRLLWKKKSLSMRLKALDHMKPETVVFYKLTSEIDSIPFWYLCIQFNSILYTQYSLRVYTVHGWTLYVCIRKRCLFFSLARNVCSQFGSIRNHSLFLFTFSQFFFFFLSFWLHENWYFIETFSNAHRLQYTLTFTWQFWWHWIKTKAFEMLCEYGFFSSRNSHSIPIYHKHGININIFLKIPSKQ